MTRSPGPSPPRRAFYPGTFDPPTGAHFDLMRRAVAVFGGLTVGLGRNSSKSPILAEDQRLDLIRSELADVPGLDVVVFDGLVAPYCVAHGFGVLVRGVRNGADLDYELPMAMANRRLAPEVDTVLLPPSLENAFVSSSLIKEILMGGGDVSPYLTPAVAQAVRRALSP